MSSLVRGSDAAAARLAAMPRRLDALLAGRGLDWAACKGMTTVDGAAADDGARLVFPATEAVEVSGAPLPAPAPPRVVALHKEAKATTDEAAAPFAGLKPVGQLDVGTTGLLLLTNDAELSLLLCAPGKVTKTYVRRVDIRGRGDAAAATRIFRGARRRGRVAATPRPRRGYSAERGAPRL